MRALSRRHRPHSKSERDKSCEILVGRGVWSPSFSPALVIFPSHAPVSRYPEFLTFERGTMPALFHKQTSDILVQREATEASRYVRARLDGLHLRRLEAPWAPKDLPPRQCAFFAHLPQFNSL